MPDILATAEMKYAINGLLSLTPDGFPLLGETAEVRNLWSAAAVWIKEGPGVGPDDRRVDDPRRRPRSIPTTPTSPASTRTPATTTTSGPAAPSTSTRPTASSTRASSGRRSATCAARRTTRAPRRSAPSTSRPAAGSGRTGTSPTRRWSSTTAIEDRPHEWDAPLVVADHERRAPRDARAASAWSTSRRSSIFDVSGPGALDYLQHLTVNNCNVAVGRSVYTPLLDAHGGFRSDLTIMRLGDDAVPGRHRRLRRAPRRALVPHAPPRRRLGHLRRQHLGVRHHRRVGPAGARPRAVDHRRRHLQRRASPTARRQEVLIDSITVRLFRISYVGELRLGGLRPDARTALRDVGPRCGRPARTFGVTAVGAGVYGTTGRLEKGYRLMGAELDGEYNAGRGRPRPARR